jgi:nucleoside-diphosphate-sugar epimerase
LADIAAPGKRSVLIVLRVGNEEASAMPVDHLRHSPNCSIAKARTRLNYAPRYSSLAAVQDALQATRESSSKPQP